MAGKTSVEEQKNNFLFVWLEKVHFIILGSKCGAKNSCTFHVLFDVKDKFEACYIVKCEALAVFKRVGISLKI